MECLIPYALGSAYAAQLYHQMKKELNIDEAFGADDLSKVNAWLKEKVHKYAGSKSPKEILLMVCLLYTSDAADEL